MLNEENPSQTIAEMAQQRNSVATWPAVAGRYDFRRGSCYGGLPGRSVERRHRALNVETAARRSPSLPAEDFQELPQAKLDYRFPSLVTAGHE